MNLTLLSSIIGIIGVFIGLLISEYFRKRSRIEKFTETFFSKKIDIYDKLFEDFLSLTNLFSELYESNKTKDEKMGVWHDSVLDFLGYTDKKFLFLGEELTIHLSLTLLSAGSLLEGDKDKILEEIYSEFKEAKLLIKKSLGLHNIEKDFINTSKSKLSSQYLEYYNMIKNNK